MPQLIDASPRISVRLYKTISRKTIDGQSAVSARYEGKSEYIDLTPYLGEGSSVVTDKSVRDPAGVFSITFADKPQNSAISEAFSMPTNALETIYGLVEPMDVVEIRMWGGVGPAPVTLPIKMRGFVTEIARSQSMSDSGTPTRQVVVSGHDYGKIWQTFQVIYLPAYAEGQALLTNFGLWEMFGVEASNATYSYEFIRNMVQKVINPHIAKFMPNNSPMPKEIKTGDTISVKHGMVNNSYQSQPGSIYDIMRYHGDVGVWNELYVEDREDGVHCVYRASPAMHMTKPKGAKTRLIQEDAIEPPIVPIPDKYVQSVSVSRTDANVANFYWVNNSKFDLLDDFSRQLFALQPGNDTVNLKEYPNSAVKYYGVRAMYAETMQGDDGLSNMGSGASPSETDTRNTKTQDWITKRVTVMRDMNKDNVVLERGSARIKGGLMRPDGKECMKAGDYAMFQTGNLSCQAYIVQIHDEYVPYQGYTATVVFERGENFVTRAGMEGGISSPWFTEQASVIK